jgi:hypothetical protein
MDRAIKLAVLPATASGHGAAIADRVRPQMFSHLPTLSECDILEIFPFSFAEPVYVGTQCCRSLLTSALFYHKLRRT